MELKIESELQENPQENCDDNENASENSRNTSDFAVFLHLLKAAIGSGILFLPYAFKRAGYVSALVCSAVIGLITCHTAVLTVRCSQVLCERTNKVSMDLGETVFTSFKLGPRWIRKYAGSVNVVTNVLVCFIQYETVVIYALYVATSAQQVIEYFTEVNLDLRIYVIAFFPIYCALALVPNFNRLVPISVLGALLLGGGLSITIYYFLEDIASPVGRLQAFTSVLAIPVFCNVLLFAVHNMTMILPLENSMKNPHHMPRLLTSNMLLNLMILVAFGFLGYNKFIDSCDTVIKNLPLQHVTAHIVKIAVTLSVVCTYGLHYYVPVSILWPLITRNVRNHRQLYEILFRLGGVTATSVIAIVIPQMAPLLGLLTALSMTTLALLIPVVINVMTKWHDRDDNVVYFYCRWAKDISIGLVWLLMLVFGVTENIRDIIKAYSVTDVNWIKC